MESPSLFLPPFSSKNLMETRVHQVSDLCERVQQEFLGFETTSQKEIEKLKSENHELQRMGKQLHDMVYSLQLELNKQTEFKNRLLAILNQMLEALPENVQNSIRESIERAKTIDLPNGANINIEGLTPLLRHSENYSNTLPKVMTFEDRQLPLPIQSLLQSSLTSSSSSASSSSSPPSSSPSSFPSTLPHESKRNGLQGSPDASSLTSFLKQSSPTSPSTSSGSPNTPSSFSSRSIIKSQTSGNGVVATKEGATGMPTGYRVRTSLPHGSVVCAVGFNNSNNALTGGKGAVKIWDLTSSRPVATLNCFTDTQNKNSTGSESYVRSFKSTFDGKTLFVAGETNLISTFNLETAQHLFNLNTNVPSCFGLVPHLETNSLFTCHNDGTIRGWDCNTGKQTKLFTGHTDGVSSLEITPDGKKLVSGGLDSSLRVWDLNTARELASYQFSTQIYCLSICPGESWLAVGLESSVVEVLNLLNSNCKYQLKLHESCVLSVKFASSGKWFVSTGKDKLLTAWKSPFGSSIFQAREPNAILSSDVSSCDKYVITGSSDRFATVYEILY